MRKQPWLPAQNAACDVASRQIPRAESSTRLFGPVLYLAQDRPHPFHRRRAWTRCGSAKELSGVPILSSILAYVRTTNSAALTSGRSQARLSSEGQDRFCGTAIGPVANLKKLTGSGVYSSRIEHW